MSSTFHSWQEFLSMGGYGLYVWGAYGSLVVSLGLGVFSTRRQRNLVMKSVLNDESAA